MSWIQGIGQVIGTGLGIAYDKRWGEYNDKRQLEQAEKLQELQLKGAKEIGEFNKKQQMDIYNKTAFNYKKQRENMEGAGLNVGLMYGGSGTGGMTVPGTQTTMPTGQSTEGRKGNQGMGLQLGLAAQQMMANIDLTKAQENKTKVEAEKLAGVDTKETTTRTEKLSADITAINQGIENAKVQNEIMQYDKAIKEVEANISNQSQEEIIKGIAIANKKLTAEIKIAEIQGTIDQKTMDEKIKQINTASIEQGLRISAQKAGLIKTNAETNSINTGISKMAEEIINMNATRQIKWEELNLKERETIVKEMLQKSVQQSTDFNTSTAAQINQWTSIITDMVGAASGAIRAVK